MYMGHRVTARPVVVTDSNPDTRVSNVSLLLIVTSQQYYERVFQVS